MHHVTYSYVLSSAAPIQDGAVSGYFEDTLTRSLLGLTVYNRLLHSGTYSPEEPGHASTKLALLVDGDYNQLLFRVTVISTDPSLCTNETSNGS
jgi:hypothetical protein